MGRVYLRTTGLGLGSSGLCDCVSNCSLARLALSLRLVHRKKEKQTETIYMTSIIRVDTVSGPLRKPLPPHPVPTTAAALLQDFARPFTLLAEKITFKTPVDVFRYTGPDQKKYEELARKLRLQQEQLTRSYSKLVSEWDSQVRGPVSHYLWFEASGASPGSSFIVRSADTLSLVRATIEQLSIPSTAGIVNLV